MSFTFEVSDVNKISDVILAKPQEFDRSWSWKLHNARTNQALVFTIYNNVQLGSNIEGSLISVQTQHGYFELHNCTSFMIFEPDEVIFIGADEKYLSCLIVGKECTCSSFTNISKDILKADFATLDAPVLLSAMQLSLTEATII